MKKETALITGSSKGLGAELALVFASNHHDVIIHGRNRDDLARVKEKIIETGGNCLIQEGDLRLDRTIEKLGNIARKMDVSVLVNNAGTDLKYETAPDKLKQSFTKIDDSQIDELIATNLLAPIKLTRRLYDLFLAKGHGTIININSLSGREPHWRRTVYCASKWGLRGFTDALRKEAREDNIRVLGVYPDRIHTKAFFDDGMEPGEVARKIYAAYQNKSVGEIIIDGR